MASHPRPPPGVRGLSSARSTMSQEPDGTLDYIVHRIPPSIEAARDLHARVQGHEEFHRRRRGDDLKELVEWVANDPRALTLQNFFGVLLSDHMMQRADEAERQARRHVEYWEGEPDRIALTPALTGYLEKLARFLAGAAGRQPVLPGRFRSMFDPEDLIELVDGLLDDAKTTGEPDWGAVAKGCLDNWAGNRAYVRPSVTAWDKAVGRLIGACQVPGIDERFVRGWVRRGGCYRMSDSRAAELDRLDRDGVQFRLVRWLRGMLWSPEVLAKLDQWFGGVDRGDHCGPEAKPPQADRASADADMARSRPKSRRKELVVARVKVLHDACTPWKGPDGITVTINKEFGTSFEQTTLQRYLRASRSAAAPPPALTQRSQRR